MACANWFDCADEKKRNLSLEQVFRLMIVKDQNDCIAFRTINVTAEEMAGCNLYLDCDNKDLTFDQLFRSLIGMDENGCPALKVIGNGGSGGSSIYAGAFPTNVQWGNIPPGTDLTGLTYDEIIELATITYINPAFSSFSIAGQNQTVEVGTIISGSKTFNWAISQGSGVVALLDIYDNTNSVALLINTANDGTQAIILAAINFTANGQTQSYKGIGHNTSPAGDFNSSNFVITASYLEFYGPTAANSANSAAVRALPDNRFTSLGTSFSMNTGTVEKIFEICMPATKTLVSVFDATAGFFITGSFTLTTFDVNDAGGNPVSYNVYRLTNAVPYASNHTFNIVTT